MLAAVRSAAVLGVDAFEATVEVEVTSSLPCWSMVGAEPMHDAHLDVRRLTVSRARRRELRTGDEVMRDGGSVTRRGVLLLDALLQFPRHVHVAFRQRLVRRRASR